MSNKIRRITYKSETYEPYYDKEEQALCIPIMFKEQVFYILISKELMKEVLKEITEI